MRPGRSRATSRSFSRRSPAGHTVSSEATTAPGASRRLSRLVRPVLQPLRRRGPADPPPLARRERRPPLRRLLAAPDSARRHARRRRGSHQACTGRRRYDPRRHFELVGRRQARHGRVGRRLLRLGSLVAVGQVPVLDPVGPPGHVRLSFPRPFDDEGRVHVADEEPPAGLGRGASSGSLLSRSTRPAPSTRRSSSSPARPSRSQAPPRTSRASANRVGPSRPTTARPRSSSS